MRRCRFPFAGNLNSTSGPDVLVAALSEALCEDPRFADVNGEPLRDDDLPWFPVGHHLIPELMRQGQPFAIGPNVLFANSQAPGAGAGEPELMSYRNFAAVFTLSRWYSALQQKHFAQKTNHFVLDYPLPQAWLAEKWEVERRTDALIYLKGGKREVEIAEWLREAFPSSATLCYGRFSRAQLFDAARTSRACFCVSREDHYPLAAVEIALMGCPIISDEKSCPVLQHGVNGILAAVRERGESESFAWAEDAAARMAIEWEAAASMNPYAIREATIAKHDPALCRERVAAQLRIG